MKKLTTTLFALAICYSTIGQITTTEFEMVKSVFNVEKKVMLTEFLQLSDPDSQKFWPIYNDYQSERGKVADTRMSLLNRYAEQYENLTDEQADAPVMEAMGLQKTELALKKKYYTQVKKALGAKVATSFWQFEEYIQTAVRYSLFESIPFVGEME